MKKKSVGEQVADELIRRITVGYYTHALPGEVPLAAELGVSRTALRDGLARLQQLGVIRKSKGYPSYIQAEHLAPPESTGREVVILANDVQPTPYSNSVLVLLQKELMSNGIHTECIIGTRFSKKRIDAIIRARPGRVYALFGSTPRLQREFADRNVPVLVIGTSHAGDALPCVDADYRPIGAHAIGLLRAQGYQRVLVVSSGRSLPGDVTTLESLQREAATAAMPIEILHIRQTTAFAARLASAIRSSRLRTAVFVSKMPQTIHCLMALLAQGLRIPDDVGVLSRDYHPLYNSISPVVCCYDCKTETTVRRTVNTLAKMTRNQPIRHAQLLVIPKYRPGTTL